MIGNFNSNLSIEICLIIDNNPQIISTYSELCGNMETNSNNTASSLLHLLQGRILTGGKEMEESNAQVIIIIIIIVLIIKHLYFNL